jgi:CMP-N-acetylneuraminic acid synthetase
MNPRIAAFVPMRHASERVPQKNYRSLAGLPLYHHIVKTLLAVPLISEVVIDTDSPFIRDDAAKHFPKVRLLERPVHLRAGTVSMNDVLLNDVKQVAADFYLQTHSTNPLLKPETISSAIGFFLSHYPAHDSLFSVTRLQTRLWDQQGKALNHDPNVLLRTQDLPPVYEENSCLYIFTANTLKSRLNRIGERPYLWEISRIESVDIDEEFDFILAEFLYHQQETNR